MPIPLLAFSLLKSQHSEVRNEDTTLKGEDQQKENVNEQDGKERKELNEENHEDAHVAEEHNEQPSWYERIKTAAISSIIYI